MSKILVRLLTDIIACLDRLRARLIGNTQEAPYRIKAQIDFDCDENEVFRISAIQLDPMMGIIEGFPIPSGHTMDSFVRLFAAAPELLAACKGAMDAKAAIEHAELSDLNA